MKITLDEVKTLDQLKGIIATKYPSVKMCNGYLSLKYQGVKLTIEPKKDCEYDINKDVPILKGLLLAVIIIVALYGIAALIYPPALARPNLLVFVGAFIFITIAGIFNQKAKPAVDNFCQELENMCNDKAVVEKMVDSTPDYSEQDNVHKKTLIRNIIIALIAAIALIPLHYSTAVGNGDYVDNGVFLIIALLCVLYSAYLAIKLWLLKRKHN